MDLVGLLVFTVVGETAVEAELMFNFAETVTDSDAAMSFAGTCPT